MANMDLDIRARLLWAKSKPHHPLWRHLLDAAAVCRSLLPRLEALAQPWTYYIVALHDIGKADPSFQSKDKILARPLEEANMSFTNIRDGYRHEARSAAWVMRHLIDCHGWGQSAAEVVSQALCGHHGSFRAPCENERSGSRSDWNEVRQQLADVIADIVGVTSAPPPFGVFDNASATGAKLAGMTVLSDWIASNHELCHFADINPELGCADYWDLACKRAAEVLDQLGLVSPPPAEACVPLFKELWPKFDQLRTSQQAAEQACLQGIEPGLAIVEAPMGDGKTEAAIYIAECWSRVLGRSGAYIALPTMATSNQMYGRYKKYLNRVRPTIETPLLVHGMAWLLDDRSPEKPAETWGDDTKEENIQSVDWFRNAKRTLLAPEAVGTIDQILMAALNVKFGFLRLLGITTKVLIIDEVHACDQYMNTLLKRLLNWCGVMRVPVIMLSATLSSGQKQGLINAFRGKDEAKIAKDCLNAYPLLTFVPFESETKFVPVVIPSDAHRTVRLNPLPGLLGHAKGTAELALREVENGGCACVLVNTVKQAQAVFRVLTGNKGARGIAPQDVELFLFHARYRAERRAQTEDKDVPRFGKHAGKNGIKPRPKKAVFVATQVAEQSMDLDFDVMLSDIAPIDLLLQRSGRLHRHDRGLRPTGQEATLHILLPKAGTFDFGNSEDLVYAKELLLRTLAILDGKTEFSLPHDFRPLIEACYGDEPVPEHVVPEDLLMAAADKRRDQLAEESGLAKTHLIAEPDPCVFQLAQMRRPVYEGEGGDASDYFRAQTRIGNDTQPALVLHDADLFEATKSAAAPPKNVLEVLFMQKVNLPGWWVRDAKPDDGYGLISDPPKWLRGHVVLLMENEEWRGHVGKKQVVIRDDHSLGLYKEDEADE